VTLVAGATCGLSDDPRLTDLIARTEQIVGSGTGQLDRIEAALCLLAAQSPRRELRACLAEQQDALRPSALEQHGDRAHDQRGLELQPAFGGGGGRVIIDADSELFEMLHAALAAEARRDAETVQDNALHAEARRQACTDEELAREALKHDPLAEDGERLAGLRKPRDRRQRAHDALRNLLQRYLDAGLAGSHNKTPVGITVTVPADRIEGRPGALPAVGGSGQRIPVSRLRQWWCDAAVTALVVSRGLIPLGITHTQRTLTAQERRASRVQHRGGCSGPRCCAPFDPLVNLVPHHVRPYATYGRTSLAETIWVCPKLHHDIHHGRTVQLRDGRHLNEHGWVEQPS
jgi:hypothetical protein